MDGVRRDREAGMQHRMRIAERPDDHRSGTVAVERNLQVHADHAVLQLCLLDQERPRRGVRGGGGARRRPRRATAAERDPGSYQRHQRHQQSALRAAATLVGLALLVLAGCALRPPVERAIAARGGEIHGLVLDAEADVHVGTPGRWEYTRAFLSPERYGWRIFTTAEPLTTLFDGTIVRSFVGTGEVSADTAESAPLRSHARWTAVVTLEALRQADLAIEPLPSAALPAGAREGLIVTFPDGSVYRLGFDADMLLIWAQGPLDLSPLGSGRVTAEFSDFRRTAGLRLPFAATYWMDDLRLADETIRAACVDPADLTPASFTDPDQLPTCR